MTGVQTCALPISGKRQEADCFAAETRSKSIAKCYLAMFWRHCGAHGDCAQEVTQTAEEKYDEESEADADERVEERLHADAIDDVDEQAETKQEGESL